MNMKWIVWKNIWFMFFMIVLGVGQNSFAQTSPWQHPGVLISQAQLDFVTQQVNEHIEPFYTEFLNAKASNYGSATYQVRGPSANGVNQCGSSSSPNIGCSDANYDSNAAYIQALLWYITQDVTYANNAIAIMNKYSSTLKGFAGFTSGYPCPGAAKTCSNGPLQAAWDSTKWPRAAEIIRYGHGGSANWAASDIAAFSAMLKNVYQPLIYNGSAFNGNWELSMIEGMMGIAVFNEDLTLLQRAQSFWNQRVPAYFYSYALDNPLYPNTHAPFPAGRATSSNWNGQTIFSLSTTGVTQETCRDLKHAEYGLASAINAAETDYIQGGTLTANLYTANGAEERFIHAMNLLAGLELAASTTAPMGFCTGAGNKITLGIGTTYVIGYNEYHNRLNNPNMGDATGTSGLLGTANTYHWIQTGVLPQKMASDGGAHMTIFEPLTHYANANAAENFTLSLLPQSQNAQPGDSVNYTVTITPRNNYHKDVNLSVQGGLPVGGTASFNPQTVPGGQGQSVLRITTAANTPAGSNLFNIIATDGTLQNNITGTLVMTNSPPTVVITANNASITQGSGLPTFTYTKNPVVTLTTNPTCTTTASLNSPTGNYPITCAGAVKAGYNFMYVPGVLTITANNAQVNVTANLQNMVYGNSLPKLTYTLNPSISLSTKPTCSTSANSQSIPGTYPITCSGAVKVGYTFSYVAGTLTIVTDKAVITARNKHTKQGRSIPALTYRVNPSRVVFVTVPTCTTPATLGSPVGSYPIKCSSGSAVGYDLAYVDGTLTIN